MAERLNVSLRETVLARLSPDAAEVLERVAAEPGSILLKARNPRNARDLLADGELLRPTSSGLSKAERHLVQFHRYEFGRILHDWVNRAVQAHPEQVGLVVLDQGRHGNMAAWEDARRQQHLLLAKCDEIRQRWDAIAAESEAPSDLLRMLGARDLSKARHQNHLLSIAALAQRVLPGPFAALSASLFLIHERRASVGKTLAAKIAAVTTSPAHARVCQLNQGMACAANGDFEAAARWYAMALSDVPQVEVAIWTVIHSCLAGAERHCGLALDFLNACSPDPADIRRIVQSGTRAMTSWHGEVAWPDRILESLRQLPKHRAAFADPLRMALVTDPTTPS